MKPKRFKYIYLLLCVALCITTISRGYYLKHHTNEGNPFSRAINTIIPEAIPGINHVIDDSLSDLEETKKMERTIERFMAQWEIKGASLAIMKNGKLLYSKGFGIADSAKGTPVNVSNIFRIASLSKLITATGIMKLWEEKKFSLDQPVFGEKASSTIRPSSTSKIPASAKSPSNTCCATKAVIRSAPATRSSVPRPSHRACRPRCRFRPTIWCVSPHRHGSASGPGKEMPIRTSVTWYWAK